MCADGPQIDKGTEYSVVEACPTPRRLVFLGGVCFAIHPQAWVSSPIITDGRSDKFLCALSRVQLQIVSLVGTQGLDTCIAAFMDMLSHPHSYSRLLGACGLLAVAKRAPCEPLAEDALRYLNDPSNSPLSPSLQVGATQYARADDDVDQR